MVTEGAAVTRKAVNDSLAHRVQQLIDGKNDPILNSLIAREGALPGRVDRDHKPVEAVDLNTNFVVRPGNEDVMAARVARSLWPAIREHARSFAGQTASVMINPGEAARESEHAEPLSDALSLDLPRRGSNASNSMSTNQRSTPLSSATSATA